MRVPLFYGNEKEDTMNIKEFILGFESAYTAMELISEEEKCNLFGSYLRGKARALWLNDQQLEQCEEPLHDQILRKSGG